MSTHTEDTRFEPYKSFKFRVETGSGDAASDDLNLRADTRGSVTEVLTLNFEEIKPVPAEPVFDVVLTSGGSDTGLFL